jgi:hypothetical protein
MYQATRRCMAVNRNIHSHSRENPKSHTHWENIWAHFRLTVSRTSTMRLRPSPLDEHLTCEDLEWQAVLQSVLYTIRQKLSLLFCLLHWPWCLFVPDSCLLWVEWRRISSYYLIYNHIDIEIVLADISYCSQHIYLPFGVNFLPVLILKSPLLWV